MFSFRLDIEENTIIEAFVCFAFVSISLPLLHKFISQDVDSHVTWDRGANGGWPLATAVMRTVVSIPKLVISQSAA
jgi:hypothetical protein